jgi:hypothetical protein
VATVHSLCTLTSENRFMSRCCTHDEEGYQQDPGEWPQYIPYVHSPLKTGLCLGAAHMMRRGISRIHRNQSISRKGAYIISRRGSHGRLARRCCPQAFLRIFSEVTYIRTLGNSSLLKIYTLPNHTITIGVIF